jgi:hypothetical protein
MVRSISKWLLTIVLLTGMSVSAQIGTEFWFAVPKLAHGHAGRPIKLCISAFDSTAVVTVSKPAASSTPLTTFTVPANGSHVYELVGNDVSSLNGFECDYNQVLNYGIYIHSTQKVNAYVAVQNNNSEIYALKGTSALGTDFLVPMQFQFQNSDYGGEARNSVQVIGTEDGTHVAITPTQPLYQNGGAANTTINITLNRGQVYNFASNYQTAAGHLAGTIVTSDKPIVVDYSDDSATPGSGYGQDLVADQLVPRNFAGSEYIVIPSPPAANNVSTSGSLQDYVFIFALEDNTDVVVHSQSGPTSYNGLMEGDKRSYHFTDNNPVFIESGHEEEDGTITPKPIFVFQVTGAGNELGGTQLPHMVCTGSMEVTYMPLLHPGGNVNHPKKLWLNLICPEANTGAFQINDAPLTATWQTVPGHTWKYCRKEIANVASLSVIKVTNSLGRFHMGVVDYHKPGDNAFDDCSISYFSSYASESSIHWDTTITHFDYCQGETILFGFDSVDVNITRIIGPDNLDLESEPFLLEGVTPENSGVYSVLAMDSRCPVATIVDSIEITVHPSVQEVVRDTICPGTAYIDNGFNIPADSTTVPGILYDTLLLGTEGFACDSMLILELSIRDSAYGEFSRSSCGNFTYNGQTYTSTGDYPNIVLPNASVNGCDSIVTLHLTILDPSVEIIASGDLCEDGELSLSVESGYDDYVWNTGEMMPSITVTEPGMYTVTVTVGDCQAEDQYNVEACEFSIYMPNTITPQGDGLNEYLYLPEYVRRFISEFEIGIYNRWGEQIYWSNDMNFKWNGNIDGKGDIKGVHVTDVYVWVIHYRNLEGKSFTRRGTVTVL